MMDQENEDGIDARVYELGYLLAPSISQDDIPVHYGNMKELVLSLGGEIIADEIPKPIPLAYSMSKVISNTRNKFNTAYFGWIKFEVSAEKALELKRRLDLDPNIVRFLILKTVRENTIASKRFIRGDMVRKKPFIRKISENETAMPINKEEIDKEIDALVAV